MVLEPKPLRQPLIYLITSGETTGQTTRTSEEFASLLRLVEAAVDVKVDFVQLREKQLSAAVLYQLTESAAALTRGSTTRLLVNDRSDIARTAGADGVHLTSSSIPTDVVRKTFGSEFLIGVSTHSLKEAANAHEKGADFVVFGPIFETSSKQRYGRPLGPEELVKVTSRLTPFPVLALGGITSQRVAECFRGGAQGMAGISMFNDPLRLARLVKEIRAVFEEQRAND
jgi:thiamine-phosphate pyrophosphorylase